MMFFVLLGSASRAELEMMPLVCYLFVVQAWQAKSPI